MTSRCIAWPSVPAWRSVSTGFPSTIAACSPPSAFADMVSPAAWSESRSTPPLGSTSLTLPVAGEGLEPREDLGGVLRLSRVEPASDEIAERPAPLDDGGIAQALLAPIDDLLRLESPDGEKILLHVPVSGVYLVEGRPHAAADDDQRRHDLDDQQPAGESRWSKGGR